jgi:hypothetical protein
MGAPIGNKNAAGGHKSRKTSSKKALLRNRKIMSKKALKNAYWSPSKKRWIPREHY